MKLYIVTACRNGSRNADSYPVGVFSKKEAAIDCANKETHNRAGKYACFVELFEMDVHSDGEPKVIYRTRSRFED